MTPAEDMGMDMEYRLARLLPRIEDDAIAGIRQSLRLSDSSCRIEQGPGERGIVRSQFTGIRVVGPRDDEKVDGSLRLDIAEGHYLIIGVHDVGGYVTGRDGAEQAFAHSFILP